MASSPEKAASWLGWAVRVAGWASLLLFLTFLGTWLLPKSCGGEKKATTPRTQGSSRVATPTPTPIPSTQLGNESRKTLELSEEYSEWISVPRNCFWTFSTTWNEMDEPIKFQFQKRPESGWIFPEDHVNFGEDQRTKAFRIKIRKGEGRLVLEVGPCH